MKARNFPFHKYGKSSNVFFRIYGADVVVTLAKIMELTHLEDVHLVLFYFAVNKLITDKAQNIFYLTTEHSDFRVYLQRNKKSKSTTVLIQ